MTRKKRLPVSLHAACDVPPRQRIWEAIRAHHADGMPVTLRSISLILPDAMPDSRIYDYLRSLVAGGYLECTNPDRARRVAGTYALMRDVGVEAPRVRRDGTVPPVPGREQLWRTLKIIGDFSAAQLADAASTPQVLIAEKTARDYCYFLRDAGYLSVTREASPGVPERYRLIPSRWTGPLAPMIQRTKQLYDPNTGEVVYSRVTKVDGGEP